MEVRRECWISWDWMVMLSCECWQFHKGPLQDQSVLSQLSSLEAYSQGQNSAGAPEGRKRSRDHREMLDYWLVFHGLFSLLSHIQDHLPRQDTTHIGWGLSTPIINQENDHMPN